MRLTWGALASGRMQSAAWNRYHARIMLRWSANEDKERSEWEVKGMMMMKLKLAARMFHDFQAGEA
jgi:hypothetical protein